MTNDGGHRGLQAGWAMARGEGAGGEAGNGSDPSDTLRMLVGFVVVVAVVVAAFLVLREDPVPVEAAAVTVDLEAQRVVVDVQPPEGCWAVLGDSSVTLEDTTLVLDLWLRAAEECATSRAFLLPRGAEALTGSVEVRQVRCESGDLACGPPIEATVS